MTMAQTVPQTMAQPCSIQFFGHRLQYLPSCIAALVATLLPLAAPSAQAVEQPPSPCVYQCSSNQIRFVPGQPITIEFINKTNGLVQLERILDLHLPRLMPQTDFVIETVVGADDEMSLVFWDEENRALRAVLHRPDAQTLQVELLPSGHDSDRAVHVANDGRVLVY
ncbi:hypothetical protein [cf. Phormidesmis sp. LEGE 11477]|uniref:hypothetical protein n=1 Tax=cf. Phormidesmis sp. LEGE 11477 TaxID=1828680 RepID=UPI0019FFE0D8|nr:hypothetical protein [cf. Phormidesmis sp. LEGE 11477]MBE9060810.1 hypothetical protein [cf. Phormidesmis sp. LEGE 11477]